MRTRADKDGSDEWCRLPRARLKYIRAYSLPGADLGGELGDAAGAELMPGRKQAAADVVVDRRARQAGPSRLTGMEHDLHTKLDWVAVDHLNTGHPDTHIIISSRDDQGQDFVMAPPLPARRLRYPQWQCLGAIRFPGSPATSLAQVHSLRDLECRRVLYALRRRLDAHHP